MNTRPKAYESSALPLSYPAVRIAAVAAREGSIHEDGGFGKSKIDFFEKKLSLGRGKNTVEVIILDG